MTSSNVAVADGTPGHGRDRVVVDRFVGLMASRLLPDLALIVDELVERIFAEDPFYARVEATLRDEVHRTITHHLDAAVRVVVDAQDPEFDSTRSLARSSAIAGVPIGALLNAYRLAAEVVWQHLVRIGRDLAARDFTPDEVLDGASLVWTRTNRYSAVISEAYDETIAERMRRVERDRAALLDALFDGRMTGDIGPGDVVHRLGLPDRASFVAVVAEGRVAGDAGDLIEEELQSAGIRSVWRVGTGHVAGIVVLQDERARPTSVDPDELDARLARRFAGRVGVSPRFAELGDLPDHVALADVARRCASAEGRRVVHHEREPIATLAVHVPGAARRSARAVLEPVLVLAPDEQGPVVETLDAWMDSGGSTSALAERLYCHRNTARNRLARVEGLLGRSLSDPKVAAEIVVAMTAWRLDPDGLRVAGLPLPLASP